MVPRSETVWDRYYAFLNDGRYTPETARTYMLHLERFAGWCDECGYKFLRAKPKDIARYIHERRDTWSQNTVNKHIVALRRFYGWAVSQKVRKDDPAKDLLMRHTTADLPKKLSGAQLRSLERAAETPLERALLLTLLGPGAIRKRELLALRVEDVDWKTGRLTIAGKIGVARETRPGANVMKALKTHLRERSSGMVFKVSESGLKRALDQLAARATVEGVTPERIRATVISWLVEGDEDLGVVAVIVGVTRATSAARYKGLRTRAAAHEQERNLAERISQA